MMVLRTCMTFGLILMACAGAQAAPDVTLEVIHRTSALGTDGIKRSTEFTEKLFRRGNTVWIERVLPAGAHQEAEHRQAKAKGAKDHKHADLSAATRWIEQRSDGKLKLRLVSDHDHVVVDIAPAEYATVGFDGSWPAAYHLIDPAVLKQLKPATSTAQSQGQWFESLAQSGANRVRVLWDAKLELPLQVQSRSANGSSERTTTVRVLSAGSKTPWTSASSYAVKDYSDFLD